MRLYITVFLMFSHTLFAQLQKNVEVEVVGRPSWQMLIPLEDNDLLMLVKSDITKLEIFKFGQELETKWHKEVFVDAEKAPTAYTIADDHISLMFSETSGMYYQVFIVDLLTGELEQSGFELREFFQDQDYVFFDKKVIMAGKNEKGAALYKYDFTKEIGFLEEKDLAGKVAVNQFEYNRESQTIEALWSVQTLGYADEKKKKGEFVKDAFVVYTVIDTTGQIVAQQKIVRNGTNFPMDGKMIKLPNGQKAVLGQYKSSEGDKGVYFYNLTTNEPLTTYSYAKLLSKPSSLAASDLSKLYSEFKFIPNAPLLGDGRIVFGGVFVRPEFSTVSDRSGSYYNPYDPYGMNNGFGRNSGMYNMPRTQTRQVFNGYNYPTGFVAEFGLDGQLINQNRVDINQLSGQIQSTLAYNVNGAVSYCLKGDLATNNFNIGNKPMLYKLTSEKSTDKRDNYLPTYQGVLHWYDNVFIANGSRLKIEAVSLNDNLDSSSTKKKKKKKSPASFSQVRKIIYLTKIASGN